MGRAITAARGGPTTQVEMTTRYFRIQGETLKIVLKINHKDQRLQHTGFRRTDTRADDRVARTDDKTQAERRGVGPLFGQGERAREGSPDRPCVLS